MVGFPPPRMRYKTGPIEVLTSWFTLDDFYLAQYGTAYLATNSEYRLIEVSPSGGVHPVAGALKELKSEVGHQLRVFKMGKPCTLP
jgi:hypothetical protein